MGTVETGRRIRATPVVVFLVAAGVSVALSASVASGPVILDGRWGILAELALWGLLWVAAVAATRRLPTRLALGMVLGAGLALRLAALAGPPVTSDDLYRYAWDARVQAAGINPYLHPPASEELAGLRESWLWPAETGCAEIDRPPGCTRINRPAAPTIYPPLAQSWFAVVAAVGPDNARHTTWQVAGLATEVGVLALLPVALGRWGGDRRWSALYALCPAPVVEIVQNGHVDGLAILLVLGALCVVAPTGRSAQAHLVSRAPSWRHFGAGALIGAAAMVKLYPAVVIPALVAVGIGRRLPVLARACAGALAVAVVAYLPHVLAVGWRVLGYLPGYLEEEDYAEGGRFLIATALGLPPVAGGALSLIAVVGVGGWVLVRRPSPPVGAAVLLGALLLATSPVQTWYGVALLAVATLAGRPWWAAVVVAAYPYYFAVILDQPHAVGLGRIAYGTALVVVVASVASSSRTLLPSTSPRRPASPGSATMG